MLFVVLALQFSGLTTVAILARLLLTFHCHGFTSPLFILEPLARNLAVEADQATDQFLKFAMLGGQALGAARVLEHHLQELYVIVIQSFTPIDLYS